MASRYNSGAVSPAPLAQPLKLHRSGRTIKNRLIKGAMAEGLATWSAKDPPARGIPTEQNVELVRRWAEGENSWGMIITGNIDIEFGTVTQMKDMIITPECPPEGHRFDMFKRVAAAAKASGSMAIGQVTHSGRQVLASINPEPVSASDVQLPAVHGMVYGKPRPATKDDIARVIEGFAHAAKYLEKSGFDGIELHGAHGYLISQFLSRKTNLRTDEYGLQSTENRLRFVTQVCDAIISQVSSDFIVGIKLNSVEFQNGGITAEDAREVCIALEEVGIDYVQLSGGNYEDFGLRWDKQSTYLREAYFLEFVQVIMEGFGSANRKIKVFLSGGLRSVGNMVGALDLVDAIVLGRPAAQEPRLADDILSGRVLGAIRPVTPVEHETTLGMMIARTHIVQISMGEDPLDTGDGKAVEQFGKDMGVWMQQKMADGDKLEVADVVQYTGETTPYGTRRQLDVTG
ncbi:hypothetical protein S7711_02912 [Stachybotrys chartarum IBT 7711]|uniref:NADH:flavin oxidoreductase/NADH oxidase N-terminal domain-containing protein n=1 Tax=Stachybotrys chartarum (strain CBS 109288 / IBT 7711) TaxID=1280523 RepID=A0A084B298_STACB|nr:hypothetical protein S7711_02912 [Stachybotrys chartarum IBT 7711]KFA56317.1 hypothetical protein S40293_08268 [Stachybotrys chartarum IBT 40293]